MGSERKGMDRFVQTRTSYTRGLDGESRRRLRDRFSILVGVVV
jgi:hypothetical protein